MRTGKGYQDEEEYGEDELGRKREGPSSNTPSNTTITKVYMEADAKNSDRASAMRSKHSVTEQRRRSKINERFQILRELIPHSDQKRDTASFLLEVIEYVQHLQEKVQKYEGSHPGWSPEPTKLMPWRNSHWRVQSFANHPQAINNGSATGMPFPGKLDESSINTTPAVIAGSLSPVESDSTRDVTCKAMDRHPEIANKRSPLSMPLQPNTHASVRSSAQSAECPATSDAAGQMEDLVVEGGTISISSVYSEGLLNSLTLALQQAGIDLSHAKISVQIELGKRANQGLPSGAAPDQDPENHRETSGAEESDQSHKRLKT